MTIGRLYEVPPSAEALLRTCNAVTEWYEALAVLAVESAPTLDAEDALISWAELLPRNSVVGMLFSGSIASPDTDNGDPVVTYVNPAMVKAVAEQLALLAKADLEAQLGNDAAASWLQEPLKQFLSEAANNDNGVVLVWGA
ncbi:MAG TPA: hypothetical protein VFV64_01695 [Permianibacter sp.]|nr:hypothetical protein [Permianibacter sp.]